MSRTPLTLAVLTIATITLAACQPPNPSTELGTSGDSAAQSGNTGEQVRNSESIKLDQTAITQQEGKTMPSGKSEKTLADFKEIPATQATLKTTKGEITFELYRNEAPLTTANFVNLASEGFYDNIVFHRVIPDFMAQVGDPLTKDASMQARWGTGGPGYSIADEFAPTLKHDGAGVVSMANSGPATGGSQFFITYEPTPRLDGKHAIFGKVTAGLDVLNQITQGDKIISVTLQ
jgi:cyclophilin family peptidyl-prolyl cis-trans isomerase